MSAAVVVYRPQNEIGFSIGSATFNTKSPSPFAWIHATAESLDSYNAVKSGTLTELDPIGQTIIKNSRANFDCGELCKKVEFLNKGKIIFQVALQDLGKYQKSFAGLKIAYASCPSAFPLYNWALADAKARAYIESICGGYWKTLPMRMDHPFA